MAKKIKLYVILLGILHSSCTRVRNSNEALIGTWAGCTKESIYSELHFHDQYYAYHLDNELLDYNIGRYVLCNDSTMLISTTHSLNCSEEVEGISSLFFSIYNDELIVKYKNQNKIDKYKRVSKVPLLNFKKGTRALEAEDYMNQFNDRKSQFKN